MARDALEARFLEALGASSWLSLEKPDMESSSEASKILGFDLAAAVGFGAALGGFDLVVVLSAALGFVVVFGAFLGLSFDSESESDTSRKVFFELALGAFLGLSSDSESTTKDFFVAFPAAAFAASDATALDFGGVFRSLILSDKLMKGSLSEFEDGSFGLALVFCFLGGEATEDQQLKNLSLPATSSSLLSAAVNFLLVPAVVAPPLPPLPPLAPPLPPRPLVAVVTAFAGASSSASCVNVG